MPSTIQRVTARLRTNSTIAATTTAPAASCAASWTPADSSLVALRIAANMIEAPKKTTSVQSSELRSTGRHHTRG